MAKPRTGWTALKHFGTILAHPQQYYRYKTQKDAFVAENHLPMHGHYDAERVGPVHPYPGADGHSIRRRGVIYPGDDHHQTVVPQNQALTDLVPHDHQAARGVPQHSLGEDRGTLVTLRSEAAHPLPVIRAAAKRGVHQHHALPDVGRTQHSTLTGAEPAAAAAIIHNNVVHMSSGHYQPDQHAAVKLAIAGKTTGTLSRRETEFHTPNGDNINLTMKQRMQTVSNWARNR